MAGVHKRELHYGQRIGWLRAAVLGANDGIVSTASLLVGVAAASAGKDAVLIAGTAGLVAGAMSMAAGEYVSVSSQADTVNADLERERHELESNVEFEREELAAIYEDRGLDSALAKEVAVKLMEHDALAAHARDELGYTDTQTVQPLQAAVTSAVSFSVGALLPLLCALFSAMSAIIPVVAGSSLIGLALAGGMAARAGGASILVGATRVTLWGALAMIATAAVGTLFGNFS